MRQTIDSDNNAHGGIGPGNRRADRRRPDQHRFRRRAVRQGRRLLLRDPELGPGLGRLRLGDGLLGHDSVQRQDTTCSTASSTLVLGLAEPGSSYFDIGLDLEKFTQEFRLVSKASGPFRMDDRRLLHQGRSGPDPDPHPEPARRQPAARAPRSCSARWRSWNSERLQGNRAFSPTARYDFDNGFKLGAGVRYAENDQTFSQDVLVRREPRAGARAIARIVLRRRLHLEPEPAVPDQRRHHGVRPGGHGLPAGRPQCRRGRACLRRWTPRP